MVESKVLLPYSTDENLKNIKVGEWDIDQNYPSLEDIFLQYLMIEEPSLRVGDGGLDALIEYITDQEEYIEDENMEYSQTTINKFLKVSKKALANVKKMPLGKILNDMPYDNRVAEEIKKLNEKKGEMTQEQIDRKLEAITNNEKYKHGYSVIKGLSIGHIGEDDLDKLFPYDVDEVGNITERQIEEEIEDVISGEGKTHPLFLIEEVAYGTPYDVKDRGPETTSRQKLTGAFSGVKRKRLEQLYNTMQGYGDLTTEEYRELREKLGKTAKDEEGKYTEELTHTEIYEELKDKYDFLDMPLSEANKRFKKDREVIGPYSIKYQNNKTKFKFGATLSYVDPSDSDSKFNFLKDLGVNITAKSDNSKDTSHSKIKKSITVNKDNKLYKELMKNNLIGIATHTKKGGEDSPDEARIQEPEKKLNDGAMEEIGEMILNEFFKDKENKERILPPQVLNPFFLTEVDWEFEIDLHPLSFLKLSDIYSKIQTTRKLGKDEVTLYLIWKWTTQTIKRYEIPRLGEKLSQRAVTLSDRTARAAQSGDWNIDPNEPLKYTKGDITKPEGKGKSQLKEAYEYMKPHAKEGENKKWGHQLIRDYASGSGNYIEVTQDYLNEMYVYPDDHPVEKLRGKSPKLGEDRYPSSYYMSPEQYQDLKDKDKDKEDKEDNPWEEKEDKGTKLREGYKLPEVRVKLKLFFSNMAARLSELDEAVKEIQTHEPVIKGDA